MPYFKTSENIKLYYELHGNGEEKILFVTGNNTTFTKIKNFYHNSFRSPHNFIDMELPDPFF